MEGCWAGRLRDGLRTSAHILEGRGVLLRTVLEGLHALSPPDSPEPAMPPDAWTLDRNPVRTPLKDESRAWTHRREDAIPNRELWNRLAPQRKEPAKHVDCSRDGRREVGGGSDFDGSLINVDVTIPPTFSAAECPRRRQV